MTIRLGDICIIARGETGIKKAIPGPYPLVTSSDERKKHVDFQFDAKAVIVPLISSTGHGHASLNRVHYQEGKFALGTILCAIIPKNPKILSAKYLHIYLTQFKDSLLVPLMKGAANVSLPMNKIASIEIFVPTFDKQREIIEFEKNTSAIFNEIRSIINNQELSVKKLKQQILQSAMQGKLVPQNSNDTPAPELLKKIKNLKEKLIEEKKIKKEKPLQAINEDEVPYEIPDSWAWCRLGDTTISYKYSIIDGPFGSDLLSSEYTESGVPILRLQNVGQNFFIKKNIKFISVNKSKELAKHNYTSGDIVISKLGDPPGRSCVIPKDIDSGIFVADIVRYRADNKYLDSNYCSLFLNSPSAISQFKTESKGMTRLRVNLMKIRNMLIPIPPIQEQHRIASKLEQLMKSCDELAQCVQINKEQTASLLQSALREALQPK